MKFTSEVHQQTGIVRLDGRFTFESHPAFKACTHSLLDNAALKTLVLDMERVTHMDASSLGAMLLLREACQPRRQVVLRRPSSTVLALLKVIQFDKLFEIQS